MVAAAATAEDGDDIITPHAAAVSAGVGTFVEPSTVAEPQASPSPTTAERRKISLPQIAHVCVHRPEFNRMPHCDMPPDEYYEAIKVHMRELFTEASEEVDEHMSAV